MLHYQQTDPMMRDARALGMQLLKEQAAENLRRRYEDALLVLAFSVCVNVGVIIWFAIQTVKVLGHS